MKIVENGTAKSPTKKSEFFSSPIKASSGKWSPKMSPVKSPGKYWRPDFKVQLKPLGFDNSLTSWIQNAKKKPEMTTIHVNIH